MTKKKDHTKAKSASLLIALFVAASAVSELVTQQGVRAMEAATRPVVSLIQIPRLPPRISIKYLLCGGLAPVVRSDTTEDMYFATRMQNHRKSLGFPFSGQDLPRSPRTNFLQFGEDAGISCANSCVFRKTMLPIVAKLTRGTSLANFYASFCTSDGRSTNAGSHRDSPDSPRFHATCPRAVVSRNYVLACKKNLEQDRSPYEANGSYL